MSLMDKVLSFFGGAEPRSIDRAIERPLDAAGAHALAETMQRDWIRLVAHLVDAMQPLVAPGEAHGAIEAMCRRIGERAVRAGLHGLTWACGKSGTKLVKRVGDARDQRLRARLLERLAIAESDGARPPAELESAAAAFLSTAAVEVIDGRRVRRSASSRVDAEHHDRAVIAAFHAYLRVVADIADELATPAAASEPARAVTAGFATAMRRIGVKPVMPALGEPPDLRSARVVGYADGAAVGAVSSVSREGLAYGREAVRKAEVVLGRAASAEARAVGGSNGEAPR